MKNKDKENVLSDYINMIKNSWTYGKMSKEEREKLQDILSSERLKGSLKGNYYTRYEILNSIYYAFLIGIGYDNFNWREEKEV